MLTGKYVLILIKSLPREIPNVLTVHRHTTIFIWESSSLLLDPLIVAFCVSTSPPISPKIRNAIQFL